MTGVLGQQVITPQQQEQQSGPINGVPILSSSVIRTEFGSAYIVGEVRNDLPNVVESLQVLARFYDSGGRLIDTGSAYTELDQLRPGEKSPFELSITDDASIAQRIANYNLTVDWDLVSGDAKPGALTIEEGEQRINGTDESYEVVGEVVNTGTGDTTLTEVIATLYDKTGNVIGTDSTYTEPSDVAAGQSAIFKITGTAGNRSNDIASVKLTAQSDDYLMIDPELEEKLEMIEQQQQQQEGNVTTFQSIEDGFRIKVPSGWAVQDVNNSDIEIQRDEEQRGMVPLAVICPQAAAQPVIGGSYECDTSNSYLSIMRFKELDDRQEFASIPDQSITISDFLAFYPKFLENRAALEGAPLGNIQVVNTTDTIVNVTSAQTNQTVATVPAKLIEYTLPYGGLFRIGSISLLVLDGTAGYSMIYLIPPFSMESEQPPMSVQKVFDSFELLQPSNNITSSPPSLTASPTPPSESQQQNQTLSVINATETGTTDDSRDGLTTSVSITKGSASKTSDAFEPDPFQTTVGAPVTWVNDDSQPHTVTSGEKATPDGRFDSGIMAPEADFEHTFTEAGEHPYFCLLHPNMVGSVSVR